MLDGKQYERVMRLHELLSRALKRIILKQIAVSNDAPFWDAATKYDEDFESGVDRHTIEIQTLIWNTYSLNFQKFAIFSLYQIQAGSGYLTSEWLTCFPLA